MAFSQAPVGARRMATIRLALVMFSTYDQTKLSIGFRSGGEGASERRVQSRSTPSEAKPGSLDLWAGAESCCHTQGLPPAT